MLTLLLLLLVIVATLLPPIGVSYLFATPTSSLRQHVQEFMNDERITRLCLEPAGPVTLAFTQNDSCKGVRVYGPSGQTTCARDVDQITSAITAVTPASVTCMSR